MSEYVSGAAEHDQSAFNPKDWKIYYTYDLGTRYTAVGAQVVRQGERPKADATIVLPLQDPVRDMVPSKQGFVRQGWPWEWRFVWGYELEELLLPDTGVGEDDIVVFEWLKVALFDSEEGFKKRQAIQERLEQIGLGDRNAYWLLIMFLREVRGAANTAAQRVWGDRVSGRVDEIAEVNFIAVPETSTPNSCRKMVHSARLAGFPNGHTISEAEASGAWGVFRLLNKGLPQGSHPLSAVRGGGELVVADAGGYTLDVSSYHTTGQLKDGSDIAIESTGRNAGGMCGAETVTFDFQNHVDRELALRFGNDWPGRFGRSRNDIMRNLAADFESYKTDFRRGIRSRGFCVGEDRVCDRPEPVQSAWVYITEDHMLSWFDSAYRKITAVIDQAMTTTPPRWMVLTGGFFRNYYITSKIYADYGKGRGIHIIDGVKDELGRCDLSVVRGWLARANVCRTEVPQRFGFGMVQEEIYDARVHTDSRERPDLIVRNEFDNTRYVNDRWCWLLRPGNIAYTDQSVFVDAPHWQLFIVSLDDPYIGKQIYWSEADIDDHVDAYPGGNKLPAIEEWDGQRRFRLSEEYLKGCEPLSEERRYRVWAKLQLRIDGLDISVRWRLAQRKFRGNPKNFRPPPACNTILLCDDSLNDKDFGAFKQRSGNVMP